MSEILSQFIRRTEGRRRILVSCWANATTLDAVEQLFGAIRRHADVEPLFVSTGGPASREMFTERGLAMVSMQDICAAAKLPNASPASDEGRLLAGYAWLFDAVHPAVLLTWNGAGDALNAASAFTAAARGVPTFFLERGLLPGTLVVDPQGVNYGSHIAGAKWAMLERSDPAAGELAAVAEYCRRLRDSTRSVVQHGESLAPDQVRDHLEIPADARVVLLPLQIENDTNITRYSPHYKQMPPIIRDVQAELAPREDVWLIVKPHPEDRSRLGELQSLCGPRTRLCGDLSLGSLLAVANVVVAVNSTVGLEALVHRKSVVVLGRAIYGEKGFTFDLDSPARLGVLLADALRAAEEGVFPDVDFQAFLAYLLTHCLFSLTADDPWRSRQRIASQIATAIGSCD